MQSFSFDKLRYILILGQFCVYTYKRCRMGNSNYFIIAVDLLLSSAHDILFDISPHVLDELISFTCLIECYTKKTHFSFFLNKNRRCKKK